jgi:hypothetical protein
LHVFFDEMWPVLRGATEVLTAFIKSDAHPRHGELPGKTFTATPGFEEHQTGDGALTQHFKIRGVSGRRMVVPYQIWMLQRLRGVIDACLANAANRRAVEAFLAGFSGGGELLQLEKILSGCPVQKQGARLFSRED